MRKILIWGVVIAMIAVLPIVAFAAENGATLADNYDSLKLSDEVMDQICGNAFQKVIKVYHVGALWDFSEVHSIDELWVKEDFVFYEFYALQSDEGGIIYRELVDDSYVNLVDNYKSRQTRYIKAFFDNAGAAKLSAMFSDIAVYNTYFLFAQGYSHHSFGSTIYYKTSKGDFIYITNLQDFGDSEYLFPIQDFCEFQQEIFKAMEIIEPYGYTQLPDPKGVRDLSKYDVNSDSFAPLSNTGNEDNEKPNPAKVYLWVGIPCVAVLVIAGVVLGTRKMRKKPTAEK